MTQTIVAVSVLNQPDERVLKIDPIPGNQKVVGPLAFIVDFDGLGCEHRPQFILKVNPLKHQGMAQGIKMPALKMAVYADHPFDPFYGLVHPPLRNTRAQEQ